MRQLDRPGRRLTHAVHQEGIVCAGEHHDVGAPAILLQEAWGDLGAYGGGAAVVQKNTASSGYSARANWNSPRGLPAPGISRPPR